MNCGVLCAGPDGNVYPVTYVPQDQQQALLMQQQLLWQQVLAAQQAGVQPDPSLMQQLCAAGLCFPGGGERGTVVCCARARVYSLPLSAAPPLLPHTHGTPCA